MKTRLIVPVMVGVALTFGLTACEQKPCAGHREVHVVQKPHYTVDAKGRLRYAGTRPQAVTVCVPNRPSRTEATR